MISMIDRPELTSQRRWIHDLWAGLKLLAESRLTDFQPLHSAKRAIATEEQAAWGGADWRSRIAGCRVTARGGGG